MKTLTFLTCMLMTLAALGNTGKKSDHPVRVLSARMNIVHLKFNKEFLGATLEIYSESGEQIALQTITERKVLIDFASQPNGIFKIKIKKDGREEEFAYVNYVDDQPENAAVADAESLTVLQGI